METKTKKVLVWTAAGIAVTGFSVWQGGKIIKKRRLVKQQHETVNAATTAIDQILKNNLTAPPGEKQLPSFSNAQLKIFSDALMRAMKGAGTNETVVLSVFGKMQNDLDLLLLIDAFGVKDEENLGLWLEGDGMTEAVNDLLNTKAHVTYRFA